MDRAEKIYEPKDRLTRMSNRLSDLLEADPEYAEGDRAIIMIMDENQGGIAIAGYEDDTNAMVDLLVHIRAIFKANGKTFTIMTAPGAGGMN